MMIGTLILLTLALVYITIHIDDLDRHNITCYVCNKHDVLLSLDRQLLNYGPFSWGMIQRVYQAKVAAGDGVKTFWFRISLDGTLEIRREN